MRPHPGLISDTVEVGDWTIIFARPDSQTAHEHEFSRVFGNEDRDIKELLSFVADPITKAYGSALRKASSLRQSRTSHLLWLEGIGGNVC